MADFSTEAYCKAKADDLSVSSFRPAGVTEVTQLAGASYGGYIGGTIGVRIGNLQGTAGILLGGFAGYAFGSGVGYVLGHLLESDKLNDAAKATDILRREIFEDCILHGPYS